MEHYQAPIAKHWRLLTPPPAQAVAELAQALGTSPTIASLLVQRGINTFAQAEAYCVPSLHELHDPFLMQGMTTAVNRLQQAIDQQTPTLIYGDYDVDGVTSAALCYSVLQALQVPVSYYIPDRHTEGYGISIQGVRWADQAGFKLLISVDCGISSHAAIQEARKLGLEVMVCDHHEPGPTLPPAHAILDPKQPRCSYPCQVLSGCGVAFKLLQGLVQRLKLPMDRLYDYLDLVAVSIACDQVPITGENRILAYHGLKRLNKQPCLGLQALIDVSQVKKPINVAGLVFGIGPHLNAAGRMAHARDAVQLLLAQDRITAQRLAKDLQAKNQQRKDLDSSMTEEALAMTQARPQHHQACTTVLFKEGWHKGVLGIVASRCVEHHYRPTIILTQSKGKATGSARSVEGYNIHQAIAACDSLLEQYGGHAHAAGLTMSLAHVDRFKQRFEEVVAQQIAPKLLHPQQVINLWISFQEINERFYHTLKRLAPFGQGNRRPVFATENVVAIRCQILKEKHLKLIVQQKDTPRLEAIGFNMASYAPLVRDSKPFKLAYVLDKHTYRGTHQLQLQIKDIQL